MYDPLTPNELPLLRMTPYYYYYALALSDNIYTEACPTGFSKASDQKSVSVVKPGIVLQNLNLYHPKQPVQWREKRWPRLE